MNASDSNSGRAQNNVLRVFGVERSAPMSLLRTFALGALLVAGCDPQADDEYKGEALASLQGTIAVADEQPSPGDVSTAVLWHDFAESDSAIVTEPVPVEGSFPAEFSLNLYEPPPDTVFIEVEGPDDGPTGKFIAVGYVAVLPNNATSGPGQFQDVWESALGTENDHLLVYAEEEVSQELLRDVFPGGMQPGYQLFKVTRPSYEELHCLDPWSDCIDVCIADFNACTEDEQTCSDESVACFGACDEEHQPDQCNQGDFRDLLSPVPITDALSLVIGGEKPYPDWY